MFRKGYDHAFFSSYLDLELMWLIRPDFRLERPSSHILQDWTDFWRSSERSVGRIRLGTHLSQVKHSYERHSERTWGKKSLYS